MLNARRPHFLMIFHPNVCSDRLSEGCKRSLVNQTLQFSALQKVPEKFIKHLEGRLCGSVLLSGPSGNSWNVKLSKHDDGLFLDDGWGMFVKDHSIECGDSFVFRYDGDLHFSVQIFDQTSCEKEVAFYAKHSDARLIGKKRETGREPIPLNAAYLGNKRKTRSTHSPAFLEFEIVSKESKMDEHGNDSLHSIRVSDDGKYHQLSCSTIKDKISMASRKAMSMSMSSQGSLQREHRARQRKPKAIKEKKSTISTLIEQRASQYFVSEFPYFVRVMKASNVSGSGTLKLPVQFSMKYLPNCRTKVVLQNLKGDSWTLSSVPTIRVQTMHTLCGGWTGFVRDNDIKFEDICIFELVGDCEMRVRVVRLGMEGIDWDGLKGDITGLVASAQFISQMDESLPRSPNIQKPKNGARVCNGRGITAAKLTDGTSEANIPSKFATEHFPSCRTEIVLRNSKGECWNVNSYPSSVRCTAHTLCGGWMSFVRENNIKLGDTCVFELVGYLGGPMGWHLSRLKMATTAASTALSTATMASSTSTLRTQKKTTAPKVKFLAGINGYQGLRIQNNVVSMGTPVSTEQCFAKIVDSMRAASSYGGNNGGALSSTCNAAVEIFKIASIMNGLVLVGVAVGFALLRIEASVEEAESELCLVE
ncbi:hypothetical protein V2J09_007547 [Rumex salicifolius]